MKLLLTPIVVAAWLLPSAHSQLEDCHSIKVSECPTDRCRKVNGKCEEFPDTTQAQGTPCFDRSGNDCENLDGQCVKVKGKCYPVNGEGMDGASCKAILTTDNQGDPFYAEVYGFGCASKHVCNVFNSTNADKMDVNITGVCESEECLGKKIPGNCNGNDPNNPECIAATERVTICHRTCSEKNPWVRITIDEDAWDGEGCGHKLQHDIRDECKNKAPWDAWGVNRKDYLIKKHGTRQNVSDALGGDTAAIKAYWRKWEPACPYVRNGACCSWDDADENPCCGEENPQPIRPAVEIVKYAGPPNTCGVDMTQQHDDLYTLSIDALDWVYCYKISVPTTSKECLIDMKFNDPSEGGIGSTWVALTNSTGGNITCPGAPPVYVEGPINPGSMAPQDCGDAVVQGTGDLSRIIVTDSDCAAVAPPTCPFDMPNPGSLHCPGKSGVFPVKVNGTDAKPTDVDIIYNISSTNGGKSVSFNVNNPFTSPAKTYVQYHAPSGTGDGWREACDDSSVGECGEMNSTITADCLYGNGKPYTLIQVFFWDANGATSIFDTSKVEVDECCKNKPPVDAAGAVAQYSILIRCECPPMDSRRRLGQKPDDEEMDIEAILALFEK